MRPRKEHIDLCRVPTGKKIKLTDYDPEWAGDPSLPKADRKAYAEKQLSQDVSDIASSQDLLYAADTWSLLLIFQAMDAAGKDSTIKHVMSGLNPQGCQVYSFKHPSAEELDHNFMWRYARVLPERGRIGIFNRSYFEEVLIVKVHKALLEAERIPNAKDEPELWAGRYEDINHFERHLVRNGTVVLKFFLNVSRNEQRKRFLKRLNDPAKHWKFSSSDLAEREYWDQYMQAYEDMLTETSTEWAPWHVIPADHKWVARALVAQFIVEAIARLDLQYPKVTDEQEKLIEEARKKLEKEEK
jgi:PPK2 family polyphosphate:nucleotide phosphotransferase